MQTEFTFKDINDVHYEMKDVQFAWGADNLVDDNELQVEEYEKLIELVFNEIKREYKDDETSRFNSLLLGKLLILANQ
tara:strand:+ start:3295 stop:3528 length:234 start_codon:yes stop_codon:yes gene_type:complete